MSHRAHNVTTANSFIASLKYMQTLPSYSYAIISALLWATSVPILNHAIEHLPDQPKRSSILTGLVVALISGTIILYILGRPIHVLEFTKYTLLAGIFTFPIATGLYYLAAFAFGAQTEIASQFVRVKPLFSILIAFFSSMK